MSIPEKKSRRQLSDVVPTAFDGIQANFCRDPECQNFGVPPRHLDADAENPHSDKLGAYKLVGAVGETESSALSGDPSAPYGEWNPRARVVSIGILLQPSSLGK